MSSLDASLNCQRPSPPALSCGTCRRRKGQRFSRKLFPGERLFGAEKLFKNIGAIFLPGPAPLFLPCIYGRTHVPFTPQGRRPKARTADTQGGQSCPSSRKKPSRRQRSFSSNAAMKSSRATVSSKTAARSTSWLRKCLVAGKILLVEVEIEFDEERPHRLRGKRGIAIINVSTSGFWSVRTSCLPVRW